MFETVQILERLVAFDTTSAKTNLGLIGFIKSFLQDRGFRITQIDDDTGQKAGLYAEAGPVGDGILLSGHTDVVPVVGQNWSRDPFRLSREGVRLYGRGTTDMKGYLAAMLRAADMAAGKDLQAPLKLVFSYDEEIGCVGIQHMIDRLIPLVGHPRACLVGEPTEMQVATGHKGKAAIRVVCNGQSGHSAAAPNFVNALHLAADFIAELRKVQDGLVQIGARDVAYDVGYSTVHIGKITGGTALNIVPDRAELSIEYRHLAADDPEQIMAQINDAAEKVARRYRQKFSAAKIELERYNTYPGLDVPADAPVVTLGKRLAATNRLIKVGYGTEAGVFAKYGLPVIVCGPGSMNGQGHKPDEFIDMDQLAACDRLMDRVVEEISR